MLKNLKLLDIGSFRNVTLEMKLEKRNRFLFGRMEITMSGFEYRNKLMFLAHGHLKLL